MVTHDYQSYHVFAAKYMCQVNVIAVYPSSLGRVIGVFVPNEKAASTFIPFATGVTMTVRTPVVMAILVEKFANNTENVRRWLSSSEPLESLNFGAEVPIINFRATLSH